MVHPVIRPVMLCSFFLLFCCSVSAEIDLERDAVRISGFANIGITQGGTETLGFRRDVSREGVFDGDASIKPDSLIGLQFDSSLGESLNATLQLVGLDRVSNSFENSIQWAYLRYRATQSITVRAGRLGADIYMLSDYRNLGFAYLWVRPPVEFYSPAFGHIDGADLAHSMALDRGTLKLRLFAGESKYNLKVSGEARDFKVTPIFGTSAFWESNHWQARLSVTSVGYDDKSVDENMGTDDLRNGLRQAALTGWTEANEIADMLEVEDTGLIYYSLGLGYDKGDWIIQSEASFIKSDFDLYRDLVSYYLSVGYRIGNAKIYAMTAQARNSEQRVHVQSPPINDPALIYLRDITQNVFDSTYIDQDTNSLGVRWDIQYNLALKFQWDHTNIAAVGAAFWDQKVIQSKPASANTYAINLNYVF